MAARNSRGRARRKNEYFFDYTLLTVVIFLIAFGLLMIYSASSYNANLNFGDPKHFVKSQLFATTLGAVVMVAVITIDYHLLQKFAVPIYIISAVLVMLVLTPLGIERNGARRWLNLGISLQPAEIAKIAVIVMVATLACKMGRYAKSFKGIVIMAVSGILMALIIGVFNKNMSTAIIVCAITAVMIFVIDPDYKKYFIGALLVAVAAGIVIFIAKTSLTSDSGFRLKRIAAWLDPTAFSSDTSFQTLQGLYAIGSGSIFGKGLGQSMQKLGFIPESQNDMIFSIICEELGIFGALVVIFLYVLLIWRCMVIANNAPDLFGALIVVGVMGHFAIQVIMNIAVVTNTMPNTGVSLPFISYGGSSALFLMAEIGLVLNVSKSIRLHELG